MAVSSTKNARVSVIPYGGGASSDLIATKWTVEVRADEIDITNFESGGFTDYLTSYVDAMGTVDGFWDKANNAPFAGPPSILVGDQPALTLYMHTENLNYYRFPVVIILSSTTDVSVRDVVRYNFSFRNKGIFYYPEEQAYTGIDE
jgi:hypothetical protein